jgi:polar amino acid transport system substrate-binding protein
MLGCSSAQKGMSMPTKIRFFVGLAGLCGVVVLASSCGGSKSAEETSTSAGTTTTIPTPSVNSDIAAEVPADIKSKGTLTVAADATYAPNEFIGADGTTVEGMSPDLGQAIGAVLGLTFKFVNASFDTIIPGLQSGKYDIGFSSFTDTKEREKVVDFVTYFTAGTSFYVQEQGGPTINSLGDLCGHSVAVERGTIQADDATAQDTKCKADGKSGVSVHVYPDQNAANLAISSGRQEVGMADSPVAAYIVEQSNGQFKLTGTPYDTAPYGIAVPKGSGMTQPILDALKELMADGTYDAILAKWGLESGAITDPQINAAVS